MKKTESITEELKKNISKGIEIDFASAGFIFSNGVKGIIKRFLKPNFMELDFCSSGGKIQVINIMKMNTYTLLNKEETEDLKRYYGTTKQ